MNNRGREHLLPPESSAPGRSLGGAKGSAEEVEKVLYKTRKDVLRPTRIRVSALVWASLVKGPHRNGAFCFATLVSFGHLYHGGKRSPRRVARSVRRGHG